MSKPGAGKELVDDLKEKWAKLNPFAKRPKTWGGEGHKLGSASAPQAPVDPQRRVTPAGSQPARPAHQSAAVRSGPSSIPPGRKLGVAASAPAAASGAPSSRPAAAPQPAQSAPARSLGIAPSSTAAGPSSAAGPVSRAGPAGTSSLTGPSLAAGPPSAAGPSSAARPSEQRDGADGDAWNGGAAASSEAALPPDVDIGEAGEELQSAAAMLRSDPAAGPAAELLAKVLRNIIASPTEPKFRRLRLSNKRIAEAVDASGGMEFLQASGFQMLFEPDATTSAEEGFLVFPDDGSIPHLRSALFVLEAGTTKQQMHQQQQRSGQDAQSAAAPFSFEAAEAARAAEGGSAGAISSIGGDDCPSGLANGASAAEGAAAPSAASGSGGMRQSPAPSEPRERRTQVLLPVEPDARVPDWILDRTPTEVKAAYAAALRKREHGQVLMTREYRTRLAAGGGPPQKTPTFATVRVRLPEGLLLQGEFNAGEPVAAVFEWLTDCLRDPAGTYELITPARRPLVTSLGTIRSADLLPSALLNFRWTQHPRDTNGKPTLQASLLAAAVPAAS